MTTFAEEVTQHLELFIKHLTDNNEVIDEYNEEFYKFMQDQQSSPSTQ